MSSSSSYPRPSVGSTPRMSQGIGRASRVSIGNPSTSTNQFTPKHNLPPLTSSSNFTPNNSRYHPSNRNTRSSIMLSNHQEEPIPMDQDSKPQDDGGAYNFLGAPQSTTLPEGRDFNPPSLQFAEHNSRLDSFMENFSVKVREIANGWSGLKEQFRDDKVGNGLKVKGLLEEKSRVEKEIDREWEVIKQEQSSDTQRRQKLSSLNSNHTSLKERSNEVQLELNEAKRILEEKTREKELEKKNYQSQVERNSPELKCLEELTGCMIRGTKNKGADETKFIFSLINSENYSETSYITMNLLTKTYELSSHSGHLKDEKLKAWLEELNVNRDLYGFIKKVRDALRKEFDNRRAEKGRGGRVA